MEDLARHLEGAPDPACAGVALLDADLDDTIVLGHDDRIELIRTFDGEEQERQCVVRQCGQRGIRKPHRVGQAHGHGFVAIDQRCGAEDGIA